MKAKQTPMTAAASVDYTAAQANKVEWGVPMSIDKKAASTLKNDEVGYRIKANKEFVAGSKTASGENIPHGHKFDAGKPRMELLPIAGVRLVAEIMTGGAHKYNENNWTGLKASRIIGAAQRHLQLYLGGQDFDKDSHQHHLGHYLANLVMLQHIINFFPDQDDRIYWGDEQDSEDRDDMHIYRLSRGFNGTSQFGLLPPDSLESAALFLTEMCNFNGDFYWTSMTYSNGAKTLVEQTLEHLLSVANRETNDLGRAIGTTMIIIDLLSHERLNDDRLFSYVYN